MLKRTLLASLVAAVAFAGAPAVAQEFGADADDDVDIDAPVRLAQNDARGGGKGAVDKDARRKEIRERVKAKIQTYVTVELSQRAGLDEKKSLQLGNAIKAHLDRKQKAREAKKQELQKLRALVDGKGKDADVKAQLKALLDKDGRDEQVQAFVDDTSKFLTPTEQAKIVLALPEVMKDTRRLIRDARQERRAGRRGNRGGGAPE